MNTASRQADEAARARTAPPILTVDGVSRHFDTADGRVDAVSDISLSVSHGEFVSIIGPSGCGKSTLFSMIGGLLPASAGAIRIDYAAGTMTAEGVTLKRGDKITIDNVAFPLELQWVARSERLEKARHFIDLVGLSGFERSYPAQLSGGMRQRVSIARTLVFEPKLLLMDEPFAALDEQTRLLLGDKVSQIQATLDQTVLLITHNIAEAVQLSDRVMIMSYRPGRNKRILPIDLPRPRTSEMLSSDAFGHYVARIWADLREEAGRGMRETEGVSARGADHASS